MRLYIFLYCFLLLSGCGLMKQYKEPSHWSELRGLYKDPIHKISCGPDALQKALRAMGIHVSRKELSHSILKNHKFSTCVRDFIALFNNDARKITFPQEILNSLKDKGYSVKKVKNYSDLNKNTDVAIVLIKEKNILNYHWMCFPIDGNILSFFGDNTLLKEIYLINK